MKERILTDRELVADLVRHEFTQFRHTKHGILWGMRTYRFMTPRRDAGGTGNFTGDSSAHHVEARTREWTRLKETMYGDMPGYKARIMARPNGLLPQKDQPIVQVVSDPLDILREPDPTLLTGVLVPNVRLAAASPPPSPVPAPLPAPPVAAQQPALPTPAPTPTPLAPTPLIETPPTVGKEATMPDAPRAVHVITEAEVRAALLASGGNRTRAADTLRIGRTTLQMYILQFKLDVPLATVWVCPFCGTQFRAQGKHLDSCPAAKAANRARSRMERDRHQQTLVRATNPAYVAPHVRAAEALATESFQAAGRPLTTEPDFAEADRPDPSTHLNRYGATPLMDAVFRTVETGRAVKVPVTSSKESRRLRSRIEHQAERHGLKAHSRRIGDDLYLWLERPTGS